jgi:hypothetical protein
MLDQGGHVTCCDDSAGSGTAELIARRRLLKAAVFAPREVPGQISAADGAGAPPGSATQPRVLTGTVVDASPHVLTLRRADSEERLALMPGTKAWKGGPVDPTALGAGDRVVARLHPSRRGVASRLWVNIGRVTGVILERDREGIVVDAGKNRGRPVIVIPRRAEGRIQVRFPRLEPGYIIDVIGLRRGAVMEGLIPATSQPAYRADQVPRRSPTGRSPTGRSPIGGRALGRSPMGGRALGRFGGSATWHEPVGQPDDAEGIAYPMLDPDVGCAEEPSPGPGCVRMPYLSIGSLVEVRNECTGDSRVLPVTGGGAATRLLCDRCVTCGTSPRGRVADLALASFVALGGELERGCFNATIAMDR